MRYLVQELVAGKWYNVRSYPDKESADSHVTSCRFGLARIRVIGR